MSREGDSGSTGSATVVHGSRRSADLLSGAQAAGPGRRRSKTSWSRVPASPGRLRGGRARSSRCPERRSSRRQPSRSSASSTRCRSSRLRDRHVEQSGNDGQANVSLRGIGVSQTLVLLDGRRLMPADGRGSPDLNVIPPALISGVEVVTGGASAAYGSDAIAGVVNFKLLDDTKGRTDGKWSQTGSATATNTHSARRRGTRSPTAAARLMGYVGYTERGQVNQDDRRSPVSAAILPGREPGVGPGDAFLAPAAPSPKTGFSVSVPTPGSVRQGLRVATATRRAPCPTSRLRRQPRRHLVLRSETGSWKRHQLSWRAWTRRWSTVGWHTYDYAPTTALQMPLDRTSVFLHGHYEFSPSGARLLQALYSDYTVNRQLAPADAGILLIPADQPYIPADLGRLLDEPPHPPHPFRSSQAHRAIGPSVSQNERELLQLTSGVPAVYSRTGNYDVYAQSGTMTGPSSQTGNVSISRFQELSFAPDGGQSICGEFNPFKVGDDFDAMRPLRLGQRVAPDQRTPDAGGGIDQRPAATHFRPGNCALRSESSTRGRILTSSRTKH